MIDIDNIMIEEMNLISDTGEIFDRKEEKEKEGDLSHIWISDNNLSFPIFFLSFFYIVFRIIEEGEEKRITKDLLFLSLSLSLFLTFGFHFSSSIGRGGTKIKIKKKKNIE